jgi:DNA-directed RNA polymerase subunit N (RpoN/RPB10)
MADAKIIPPVVCFSCGKPTGHMYPKWKELRKEKGNEPSVVRADLKRLGLRRVCCIRMILTGTQQAAIKVEGRFMRCSKHVREKEQRENDQFVQTVLQPDQPGHPSQ